MASPNHNSSALPEEHSENENRNVSSTAMDSAINQTELETAMNTSIASSGDEDDGVVGSASAVQSTSNRHPKSSGKLKKRSRLLRNYIEDKAEEGSDDDENEYQTSKKSKKRRREISNKADDDDDDDDDDEDDDIADGFIVRDAQAGEVADDESSADEDDSDDENDDSDDDSERGDKHIKNTEGDSSGDEKDTKKKRKRRLRKKREYRLEDEDLELVRENLGTSSFAPEPTSNTANADTTTTPLDAMPEEAPEMMDMRRPLEEDLSDVDSDEMGDFIENDLGVDEAAIAARRRRRARRDKLNSSGVFGGATNDEMAMFEEIFGVGARIFMDETAMQEATDTDAAARIASRTLAEAFGDPSLLEQAQEPEDKTIAKGAGIAKAQDAALSLSSQYEPSTMDKMFFNKTDRTVKSTDMPERLFFTLPIRAQRLGAKKDSETGRFVSSETELDRQKESEWIAHKLVEELRQNQVDLSVHRVCSGVYYNRYHPDPNVGGNGTYTDETSAIHAAIAESIVHFLRFYFDDMYEVPTIWLTRKDFLSPGLTIKDLWRIVDFDDEWSKLQARKRTIHRLLNRVSDTIDQSSKSALTGQLIASKSDDGYPSTSMSNSLTSSSNMDDFAMDIDSSHTNDMMSNQSTSNVASEDLTSNSGVSNTMMETKEHTSEPLDPKDYSSTSIKTTMDTIQKMLQLCDDTNEDDELVDIVTYANLVLSAHDLKKNGITQGGNDTFGSSDQADESNANVEHGDKRAIFSRRPKSYKDLYMRAHHAGLHRLAHGMCIDGSQLSDNLQKYLQASKTDRNQSLQLPHPAPQGLSDPSKEADSGAFSEVFTAANKLVSDQYPGAQDVLRTCRFIVALELALDPSVRRILRQVYRQSVHVSTYPTQKGRLEVDPFHEFFGLHVLRGKPLKTFHSCDPPVHPGSLNTIRPDSRYPHAQPVVETPDLVDEEYPPISADALARVDSLGISQGYGNSAGFERVAWETNMTSGPLGEPVQTTGLPPVGSIALQQHIQRVLGFHSLQAGGKAQWALLRRAEEQGYLRTFIHCGTRATSLEKVAMEANNSKLGSNRRNIAITVTSSMNSRDTMAEEILLDVLCPCFLSPAGLNALYSRSARITLEALSSAQLDTFDRFRADAIELAVRKFIVPSFEKEVRQLLDKEAQTVVCDEFANSLRRRALVGPLRRSAMDESYIRWMARESGVVRVLKQSNNDNGYESDESMEKRTNQQNLDAANQAELDTICALLTHAAQEDDEEQAEDRKRYLGSYGWETKPIVLALVGAAEGITHQSDTAVIINVDGELLESVALPRDRVSRTNKLTELMFTFCPDCAIVGTGAGSRARGLLRGLQEASIQFIALVRSARNAVLRSRRVKHGGSSMPSGAPEDYDTTSLGQIKAAQRSNISKSSTVLNTDGIVNGYILGGEFGPDGKYASLASIAARWGRHGQWEKRIPRAVVPKDSLRQGDSIQSIQSMDRLPPTDHLDQRAFPIMFMDDSVAHIFANSERGSLEFPENDSTVRAAVSLGRYVQNPLAELAYLWPLRGDERANRLALAAGVASNGSELLTLSLHQLQDAVPAPILLRAAERVLVDMVNLVGVDLNTVAPRPHLAAMLQFVAGFGPRKATQFIQMFQSEQSRRANTRSASGSGSTNISWAPGAPPFVIISREQLIREGFITPNVFYNSAHVMMFPDYRMMGFGGITSALHEFDDTHAEEEEETNDALYEDIAGSRMHGNGAQSMFSPTSGFTTAIGRAKHVQTHNEDVASWASTSTVSFNEIRRRNPLDATRIHPEWYRFAVQVCKTANDTQPDGERYQDYVAHEVPSIDLSLPSTYRRLVLITVARVQSNVRNWLIETTRDSFKTSMREDPFAQIPPGPESSVPLCLWSPNSDMCEVGASMAAYLESLTISDDTKSSSHTLSRRAQLQNILGVGEEAEPQDVLREQDLAAFASMLESRATDGIQKTRYFHWLDTIKTELRACYRDTRRPFLPLSASTEFRLLTGETVRSLRPGVVTHATILSVKRSIVRVRLDIGGLVGIIKAEQASRQHWRDVDLSKLFQQGQVIVARVVNINRSRFQVELTVLDDIVKAPAPLPYMDHYSDPITAKTLLQEAEKERLFAAAQYDEGARAALRKGGLLSAAEALIARPIGHPVFHNVIRGEAEKILQDKAIYEAIIRPSSKGTSQLTITWKFGDGVYVHIPIEEHDKPKDAPEGDLALGQRLVVRGYEYSDLDEVMARYMDPLIGFVRDLQTHKSFRVATPDQIKKIMREDLRQNPKRIPYYIVPSIDSPGAFSIWYWLPKQTKPRAEYVSLTPDGYKLHGKISNTPSSLIEEFKRQMKEYMKQSGHPKQSTTTHPHERRSRWGANTQAHYPQRYTDPHGHIDGSRMVGHGGYNGPIPIPPAPPAPHPIQPHSMQLQDDRSRTQSRWGR